jgi:hypothetical protein
VQYPLAWAQVRLGFLGFEHFATLVDAAFGASPMR